jgi:hypothetical protein
MKNNLSIKDPPILFFRIFVSLFLLILWLPLAQMKFSIIPELSFNENRTLAEKPYLRHMSDLLSFAAKYEGYFNDHYGFRSSLVRLDSLLHLNVFNMSITPRVIIGDQGWLWYDDPVDGVSLKDYYGSATFSDAELRRLKDRIIYINDELKKFNTHLLVVVAPNKHTIYPEYLPAIIRQAKGGKTRLDQVIRVLNNSGVDFIDLRTRLMAEKKCSSYPLYYRTDTHWNDLGAFFGYEEIITRLRRIYPHIKQLGIDDFIVRAETNRGSGDLANFLNLYGTLADTHITLTPKVKFSAEKMPADQASAAGSNIIRFQIPNCNLPVLVVFRDSFTEALMPFLSESFSKSIYLKWLSGGQIDLSVIAREKPAIVIFEIVERYEGEFSAI